MLLTFRVVVVILIVFHSFGSNNARDCISNADCFTYQCEDKSKYPVCYDGCQCYTWAEYKRNLETSCRAYDCDSPKEGVCESIDPYTNRPDLTVKCKCGKRKDRSCGTKVECPLCGSALSDNCVNGKCVCEKCEGTCSKPSYRCLLSSEIPVGCPSGQCGCGTKRCKTKADCPSCGNGETVRLCDKRYDSGSCTGCLSQDACTSHSDCQLGKCCVRVIEDGGSYGTCRGRSGCKGEYTEDVHKCPTNEACKG